MKYFAITKGKILIHCLRTITLSVLFCAVSARGQVAYDPGWQQVTDWHEWIDQDALAILASAQRAKFLALRNDDERQQFARQVWSENDPGSHYDRLAYADRKFAFDDGKGSQTDRGLVYIRFGPPDSVTRYGSSESWSYRTRLGVTFSRTQTGEYRLEAMGGGGSVLEMNPRAAFLGEDPQPELPNEFGGGPPPKECRCEGFQQPPETQTTTRHKPYVETSLFPVTKAATRVMLLLSEKQLWFHNKPNALGHTLQFRGRVLSPAGKEIVKFTDFWPPRSSPDTTWPLNRCERLYLSPGGYHLEIDAFDWSASSQLAHCKASFEIPDAAGAHPSGRLPQDPYFCQ